LFAFFVVMYSISSVNEGKYRVLSDAIVAAFRSQEKSVRPIQVGQPTRAPKSNQMEVQKTPGILKTPNPPIKLLDQAIENMKASGKLTKEEKDMLDLIKKLGGIDALEKLRGLANLQGMGELLDKAGVATSSDQQKLLSDSDVQAIKEGLKNLADLGGVEGLQKLAEIGGLQGLEELAKIGGVEGLEKLMAAARGEGARNIAKIADDIELAMSGLIQRDLITVDRSDQWIEVEINTSILYPSGSAHLQPDAVPVLKELARILRDFPNPMRIEGFTDNIPINTLVYPSNWELSSARASRVVRLFTDEGIAPERMAAIGYGEYRPVASNDTAVGRAKNRRVVLVVLANHDVEDLFNNGILKSGQRTGGFQQPGGQSDASDSTIDQPPEADRGIENPSPPVPQRQVVDVIQAPQKSVESPVETPANAPQKAIAAKQPALPETASLPPQPEVVQDAPLSVPQNEAPVEAVTPVAKESPPAPREPVVFPSRANAPGILNEPAQVMKAPAAVIEPVITVPLPVLVPPIKFLPSISKAMGGAETGYMTLPAGEANRIGIEPTQSSLPDRGKEGITTEPRREMSDSFQAPQAIADTHQAKSPVATSEFKRESMPENDVVKAETPVEQSTSIPRDPVIFPSNSSIPGVINESVSPVPVISPPIKFAPPIIRPITSVSK